MGPKVYSPRAQKSLLQSGVKKRVWAGDVCALRPLRDRHVSPSCHLLSVRWVTGLPPTGLWRQRRKTDLDKEGLREVTFAYALGCYGDVSPNTRKLSMLEGPAAFKTHALKRWEQIVEAK